MKNNFVFQCFALSLFFSEQFLSAQISLWSDNNPYNSNLKKGDIIHVVIKEKFLISADGQWKSSGDFELKITPDAKNLNFLNNSQSNKTRKANNKEVINLEKKISFEIAATIGDIGPGGDNYNINAYKILTLDNMISTIQLSGTIRADSVTNGMIESSKIANLNLFISAKPNPPKDNSVTLKEKSEMPKAETQEGGTAGQETKNKSEVEKYEISEEKKKELILNQFREIINAVTN
ncbi:MAG: flagellar basal body L-ring protein FlgH [Spirochaetia bacterium]|nr:flagellar basal body L-ring protein FlgH [Spirochaetia bacterium]